MELHSHSNTDYSQNGGIFIGNLLLIASTVLFDFMAELTADDVYKWTYRIVAIISLIALGYINVSRAIELFNKSRKK